MNSLITYHLYIDIVEVRSPGGRSMNGLIIIAHPYSGHSVVRSQSSRSKTAENVVQDLIDDLINDLVNDLITLPDLKRRRKWFKT